MTSIHLPDTPDEEAWLFAAVAVVSVMFTTITLLLGVLA